MASLSTSPVGPAYNPKGLCRIVGIACLAGFLVDLFVLTFPPAVTNLQWRVAFMQQVGDRSIILLFGLALLMYGILDFRRWRRRLAMFSLVLGVIFTLSSILVVRDSLTLQQQTLSNIGNQAAQIQTQIQKAQSDPKAAPNVTPEQLEQAAQAISGRANQLKENAKTSVVRAAVSSVGNLVVVGLAMIALGQYGARPPKA